jgi:nucleoside-diphosphate-sugar epimerase
VAERFLVTGVLGCLGAWVARTLVLDGADVVGVAVGGDPLRLREIMTPDELDRVALVRGDVTKQDDLGRALDQHEITHVIHLAALQIPFCRADPALGAAVNVVGTVNVFEAVKRRRDRIAGPLVYASSAAYFGPDDTIGAGEREDSLSRPVSHYGVYKQANEGSARVYWQDEGVPSLGLRPYVVYGPARDQGVTAAPTLATKAAALGESYHLGFGGRFTVNYTEDAARALVAMSRSSFEGAATFNLPGSAVHMRDVVAAIEAAVPEAAGTITYDDVPLPLPWEMAVGGLEAAVGTVPVTPLEDAVRATVEHFRSRRAA